WEQIVEPPSSELGAHFFPFCFEPELPPAIFLAGSISFTIFNQLACIDRFKIKLSYARKASGLIVEFYYDSELFRPVDIRYLIGHFQSLLESVIASPTAKVGELEMLTAAERRQLFIEYNSTETEWPRDRFVHELFSEQAERRPEAVAVICREEHFTYCKL